MRRAHLLAGSALAFGSVGIVLLSGAASPTEDARIAGAPLQQSVDEAAAFANLAVTTPIPEPMRIKPAPVGPAELDLGAIELDGDHYVARLVDGRHAVLTLDPDLQELAEQLLLEARAPRGAIVAMAPDGRILALAGRRAAKQQGSREGAYDPKLATEAWAPAASIFKLATATALVDAGVDPSDKVCFHGGLRSVVESNLRDDKKDSRCESLAFGVAHSNNAILGKFAFQKLEPAQLESAAKKLSWMQKVPELHGVIGELALPVTRDLEFARAAAGFSSTAGGAKLSVLGGAVVAATFANAGSQPAPRLIDSIDGTAIVPIPARKAISATTARAVAKMMVQTCDDGSASRSFGKRNAIRVAGKTGTLAQTEPFYMEHSWFVGFAPAESPQIVVSVLFGNGENWHLRGQEAARRLIDRATRREKDRKRPKPRS